MIVWAGTKTTSQPRVGPSSPLTCRDCDVVVIGRMSRNSDAAVIGMRVRKCDVEVVGMGGRRNCVVMVIDEHGGRHRDENGD